MRLAARLVAAVVLTAATTALPVAPAAAAACPSADGVTVVVDYHELGGGVSQVCDAGAGQYASARFKDAGFTLTRVQSQPGFVCRVEGKPASDPCQNVPPQDAYWGLWWSDGKSGSWTYASQGVDSLKVPEGGYVAFSWNGGSTKSPPGAAPTAHANPSPSPTPKPTPKPSPQPGGGSSGSSGGGGPGPSGAGPTSPAATTGGSATPSSSATTGNGAGGQARDQRRDRAGDRAWGGAHDAGDGDKRERKPDRLRAGRDRDQGEDDLSASPSATDSPGVTSAAAPTSEAASSGGDGMPVWVAPSAIGLLFAAAAVTAVVRRRRGAAGT
jgi:hypothetical protein